MSVSCSAASPSSIEKTILGLECGRSICECNFSLVSILYPTISTRLKSSCQSTSESCQLSDPSRVLPVETWNCNRRLQSDEAGAEENAGSLFVKHFEFMDIREIERVSLVSVKNFCNDMSRKIRRHEVPIRGTEAAKSIVCIL